MRENLSFSHANNKDTDQIAHLPNLASRLYNFFMLNSTELAISTAHNNKNAVKYRLSDDVFIMLINAKMPTIISIFIL